MEGNGRIPACRSNRKAKTVPRTQKDASVLGWPGGDGGNGLRSR